MNIAELTIKSALAFIAGAVALLLCLRWLVRYRRWRNARASEKREVERQLARIRGEAE